MNVFFTSVSHGKLGRELNEIYMPLSRLLSEGLAQKDYGAGANKWFLLFGMLPKAFLTKETSEIIRFDKKAKEFEHRLILSNDAFHKADNVGRKALVTEIIMRSLDLMVEKNILNFDAKSLKADVEAILAE